MACPVDCITIETIKSTPDVDLGLTSVGTKKRLYVPRFDIDIAKCCYCGLCVPPCPTECIKMTDVYEFSEYDRQTLIYNFADDDAGGRRPGKGEAGRVRERAGSEESCRGRRAEARGPGCRPGAAPKPATPAAAPNPAPPAASAAAEKQRGLHQQLEQTSSLMQLFDLVFYVFAFITIVSAFIVVFSKNIIYSAFALLFTFFGVAGLYVLLQADFLAVTQILIYVGGILVLLLFGVMLTNKVISVEIKTGTIQTIPALILVAIVAGIAGGALLLHLERPRDRRMITLPPTTTRRSGRC